MATHNVIIQRMAYHPDTVEIEAGDEVVWTNRDNPPHTATSDELVNGQPKWNTGRLSRGQSSDPITFPEPGENPYHCTIHPRMRGTVIVQ